MNKFSLKKNKKGFTLVELIIVIVILGILAAIAIPTMSGFINDARLRSAESNCRNVYSAASAALAETKEPIATGDIAGNTSGNFSNRIKDLLGIAHGSTQFGGGDYAISFTAASGEIPAKITKVVWTGDTHKATYDASGGTMTTEPK